MMDSLSAVLADIHRHLGRAAADRKSPMHTPVVATADADLRVMVLRSYDSHANLLRFHTDARSPKVTSVMRNPSVSVLAYDPDARIQIRMRGRGWVERDGPVADAAWTASSTFARRCYLAETAPGAAGEAPTSGLPEWAEGINPTEHQIAPARANFAVLLVEVAEYDWLFLSNDGHRRAKFAAGEGTWAVP